MPLTPVKSLSRAALNSRRTFGFRRSSDTTQPTKPPCKVFSLHVAHNVDILRRLNDIMAALNCPPGSSMAFSMHYNGIRVLIHDKTGLKKDM